MAQGAEAEATGREKRKADEKRRPQQIAIARRQTERRGRRAATEPSSGRCELRKIGSKLPPQWKRHEAPRLAAEGGAAAATAHELRSRLVAVGRRRSSRGQRGDLDEHESTATGRSSSPP